MATERDVEVPDQDYPRIVTDERFGGEPRIAGRRITVLDVYDHVRDGTGDMAPSEFAEMFQLDVVDVYHALAYYHAHPEEMDHHRESRERASDALRERVARERPTGIEPDG